MNQGKEEKEEKHVAFEYKRQEHRRTRHHFTAQLRRRNKATEPLVQPHYNYVHSQEKLIMNPFKLALFAAVAASSAMAAPQYGSSSSGHSAPQKNRCEWRREVEYVESVRDECKTLYR